MRWPWVRSELRAAGDGAEDATALAIADLEDRALGIRGDPATLALVQAGVGMIEAAFAVARVRPAVPALDPAMLALMGRAAAIRGEFTGAVELEAGQGVLRPGTAVEIRGGAAPATWRYRLSLVAPNGPVERTYPADAVAHIVWHADPARPWRGQSPLRTARLTAESAVGAERTMTRELAIKPARLVPAPGLDPKQAAEIADKVRDGGVRGVGWGRGGGATGRATGGGDPTPAVLRPDPASGIVTLRSASATEIAAALGIPTPLISPDAAGQGQREAYRRFALLTVAPMLNVAAGVLREALDMPALRLDVGPLGAIDTISRARVAKALVDAGWSRDQAAAAAGLVADLDPLDSDPGE